MSDGTADDEEAENEMRELPYLFEKELIENQNKRIYVVDEYIPTIKVAPIASKFQARHDQDPIMDEKTYEGYMKVAERFLNRKEVARNVVPLESKKYGWIPQALDHRTVFELNGRPGCKNRCDLTIFGEKVHCGKITQRPPFVGVRFFLR